jgi:hypothetical protein
MRGLAVVVVVVVVVEVAMVSVCLLLGCCARGAIRSLYLVLEAFIGSKSIA